MPQNPQKLQTNEKELFCFEFMGVIHIGRKSRAHSYSYTFMQELTKSDNKQNI